MKEEIFVEVLDEGTPVFQGIESEKLADSIYRVGQPPFAYDPTDLHLMFPPGTVVRCAPRDLHGRPMAPVAIQAVDWPHPLGPSGST